MVAEANFRGMPVDTLYARELAAKLENDAAVLLEKLAPHGVTEKIVRSPMQLGKLLFDDWKLPVLKENTGKKTGKVSRATDKEVLHELAFC
jgi:DNA polymerase I-like protein with 3'-5' exonuclease and polymerase domains